MRVDFDPDAGESARLFRPGRQDPRQDEGARLRRLSRRGGRIGACASGREEALRAANSCVPAGMAGDAKDGDLVAIEPLREGRLGLAAGAGRRDDRLGEVRARGEPHRARDASHPACLFARDAERGRRRAARFVLPLRARTGANCRSSPSTRPTPRTTTTRSMPSPIPILTNSGGFVVTVAIADVAAYVQPGMAMDREALERGNSVYFPDRVVPMLPERISNDLCSLRPQEDRPALAVRMVLGADGRKRSHKFHRIMMRSAAKLSYEQAQAAIDGRPDETTEPLVETVLKPLYAAYAVVKIERERRNPLDLDLPERKLVLDCRGAPQGRALAGAARRASADRGVHDPRQCRRRRDRSKPQHSPLLYRAHDAPSDEKLNDLIEFLRTIGVKLAKGERVRPSHFNGILSRVRGQGGRGPGQRGGVARPGAGRIQPRELRPFRPQPAPLRAFHFADPPLRRSHRPSRADPRAEPRRRRPQRHARGRTGADRRAYLRPPNAARWRPNAKPSTGWSRRISPIASARCSRAASRASPASACS